MTRYLGALAGVLLALLSPVAVFAEDCPLESIAVVTPRHQTTLYIDTNGSIAVPFEAEPGCVAEAKRVEFYLAQPGSTAFTSIGQDTAYPYRASYTFLGTTFDSPWTLRAVAVPEDTDADSVSVESTFTFVAVSDGTDSTGNGLPDAPFATLMGNTDIWRATGAFANGAYTLVGAASAMYGYAAAQEPYPTSTTISLASPHNSGQTLTVEASQSLLEEGERGMLIVAMAPDAISLMGDTEAARPVNAAPSSEMDPDAQYVQVSLLVSDDDGATYSAVAASRLAGHPLELTLSGLDLEGGEDYTLARYPTTIETVSGAIRIASATGSWASVANQETDYETGALTANLTSTGLFAPFAQAEVDSGGTSTGETTFWMILSPILLALGILEVADGSGPCFIATAAYGTPMAADIDTLRQFRDEVLLTSAGGSLAVDAYYRLSPPIADWVAASPVLAAIVRACLIPVLWLARIVMALPTATLTLVALVGVAFVFRRRHRKA